jgi:hypothetical protein
MGIDLQNLAGYGWRVDDLDTDEMILNMGPQHPSTHGVLRIELRTDGEVVKGARPHIGYLHRCFEKHSENVDYPGVIPYTDPAARPGEDPRPLRVDLRRAAPRQLHLGGRGEP